MRKNVLLIVVDSLRYDIVFGDKQANLPTIQSVAEEGLTFNNCFSQGTATSPAMTALLTGRLPLNCNGHRQLNPDESTIIKAFQDAGYTTFGVHSNPNISAKRGYNKGFDRFIESISTIDGQKIPSFLPDYSVNYLSKVARLLQKAPYDTAKKIKDIAISEIECADEPWFGWVHFMDAHGPYMGKQKTYRKKFRSERLWRKAAVTSPDKITEDEQEQLWIDYCNEVEYVDQAIGDLQSHLHEKGLLEDTMIIITSDHGEEFGEHGEYSHGNLPYEELIHVPLIIYDNGLPAKTISDKVRLMDLIPSIFEYLEGDLDKETQEYLDGCPCIREFTQESLDSDTPIISEVELSDNETLRIGIRDYPWKLIFESQDEYYLFDLSVDPAEEDNLYGQGYDVEERLVDMLNERLESISIKTPNSVEVNPGVDDQLKALGYK